ncbi:protein c-ras sc1 [Globomyces pollinis-pini]|nr:protein c-ras sc1 [Globomyces pollinis-pini]
MLYRLVVLGDGGVGKTALTIRFCRSQFIEQYDPTIEDSYRKQIQVHGTTCILDILDTAGQEEFTSLRDQWIREGDAFLLLYSVTSKSSFQLIRQLLAQIEQVKDSNQVPFILIGTKCDRSDRDVKYESGLQLSKILSSAGPCHFLETSAKTGFNVDKAFYTVNDFFL